MVRNRGGEGYGSRPLRGYIARELEPKTSQFDVSDFLLPSNTGWAAIRWGPRVRMAVRLEGRELRGMFLAGPGRSAENRVTGPVASVGTRHAVTICERFAH
jgi:hypothetical protein